MGVEFEHSASEDVGGQPLLSVALLAGLLPVGRSELEQSRVWPVGQQTEEVSQVVTRLDTVQATAGEQAHEDSIDLRAIVASDKEPIASTYRFATQLSLRDVVAQRQPPIFEKRRNACSWLSEYWIAFCMGVSSSTT